MSAALTVFWDASRTGTLEADSRGRLRFTYEPAWLSDRAVPALSVSLPKRAQTFDDHECRPFFAGLLPEEEPLELVARALGKSKGNPFGLLEALGGDVAGALTLSTADAPIPPSAPQPPQLLSEDELATILTTLPKRPLLAGEEGLRLSLAGAQAKLPVLLVEGQVAKPAAGQPTTHIIKPAIQRLRGTVENELLVMRLAEALGLDVAPVEARVAAGQPYLLITRYDRSRDESGVTRRLHQEDFCQALAILPSRKYQSEGGPGFADCADLLRRVSATPAVDVLKLADAAIFNAITGNCDAHGKNFSLLYRDTAITFAPLYDLLCTVAYPELSPRFAMSVAKRRRIEEIGTTAWREFGATIGLGARIVLRRVREIGHGIQEAANPLADQLASPALDAAALREVAAVITARAERAIKMSEA